MSAKRKKVVYLKFQIKNTFPMLDLSSFQKPYAASDCLQSYHFYLAFYNLFYA